MADDPKELLFGFTEGLGAFAAENDVQAAQAGAFMNLLGSVYEESIIDFKTKELISVGIALYHRCPYCIALHSFNALDAGATKEEILQASMVAVAFGGGPSIAYSVTLLKNCIETFQGDSFTEEDRMEILRRLGRA
ncbi:carboxymuconolactone decarboxylase family protein [Methanococcoides sp. FTZ1]|uniref:carboxymuconolactone decarboxylase family protein n=1 Tax=Methanococcoides sp. FTZ1 TaxID=3439061 RepID=UPI003F878832